MLAKFHAILITLIQPKLNIITVISISFCVNLMKLFIEIPEILPVIDGGVTDKPVMCFATTK